MLESPVSVTLALDAELYHAARECAEQCGMKDVPELIEYVLRGALRAQERAQDASELQQVQERLRDLGYLE